MTAPSFMIASIVSHSSSWLPSMSMTWSPCRRRARAGARRPGRSGGHLVEGEPLAREPSSSTIQSAMRSLPVGDDVEPVGGPVERVADVGPAELGACAASAESAARSWSRAARYAAVGFGSGTGRSCRIRPTHMLRETRRICSDPRLFRARGLPGDVTLQSHRNTVGLVSPGWSRNALPLHPSALREDRPDSRSPIGTETVPPRALPR